jgi:hypothetical protein
MSEDERGALWNYAPESGPDTSAVTSAPLRNQGFPD